MNDVLLVDVGNSQIKCGIARDQEIQIVRPLPSDPLRWATLHELFANLPTQAFVAGVHPARRSAFAAWLKHQGIAVQELTHFHQIPLRISPTIDQPQTIGHDRLLGCVAARQGRDTVESTITIDCGTATTINLVDRNGEFQGGFIMPGLELMARSLHEATAALPSVEFTLVDLGTNLATFPGKNTTSAIRGGIQAATIGAIRLALDQVPSIDPTFQSKANLIRLIVTGGAAAYILPALTDLGAIHRPSLVLEGLLYTARSRA